MRFSGLNRRRQPGPGDLPPQWLVVGLGNPGPEYANTRHNVGFRVIDLLGQRHRIEVRSRERQSLGGYGKIGEESVALVKPQTYMNVSGRAVVSYSRAFAFKPESILVVYDDMDLPIGRLRIRPQGSAGGHNGIKSIIAELGSDAFPRVRIGVGRPRGGDAIGHVLSKFTGPEVGEIRDAIERAADAVECILSDGLETAMNRFNPSG